MANVNISDLSAGLKERREHYSTIFGLALDNGFGNTDFVSFPVDQKYEIKRKSLGNITQPGKKNRHVLKDFNSPSGFITIQSRKGEVQPMKVDLEFEEDEIEDLNNSFMQEMGTSNPNDINSLAGYDFIVDQIFGQMGHEVNAALYNAELGYNNDDGDATTAFQGGLNLFDGLNVKFDEAVADSSIASGQVVTKAVAGWSAGNVLDELAKIIDNVASQDDIMREINDQSMNMTYSIFLDPIIKPMLIKALEALPYKSEKIVYKDANGIFRPSAIEKTQLKFRNFMSNAGGESFFSPDDNLFILPQKGLVGADARSSASFKVEELGRGIKFYVDAKLDVNFADPRTVVLYR